MPLERDDAIVIVQTLVALLKVQPEPDIQTILQTYSMCEKKLKEHKASAERVMRK